MMFSLKVLALLTVVSSSTAAAKGLSASAPVKGGFGGVGAALKDDFAMMEDDFEAPSASLAFEEAFEELTSPSKQASDLEPEKPFLLTLVLDLMILAVVAHGFQRFREEYMGTTKQPFTPPVVFEDVVVQKNETMATAAVFDAFARAVQTGDEATCLRLLEETPELAKITDSCGCSALHLAAHQGCMRVVSKLLELRCDTNAKDCWDETPLHFAARAGQVEACRELLAAGSELEAKNLSERNAVLVAAEAKQDGVCRFLLEKGATAGDLEDSELPTMFSMLVFERMLLATCPSSQE